MKRSDNLSKVTNVKQTVKKSAGKPKKPSSTGTKKTSKPSTSTRTASKKPAASKKTAASKKPSSTPSQQTATTKPKRKGSTHHIGVKARSKYVKTLYEVTKGKEGAKRVKAINDESRRIQNLTNKRIAKLKKFEEETGYTSPALRKLRESGYELGATSSWNEEYLQQAEENYKSVLDFLKDPTSTISGTKKNIKEILKDLQKSGYTGDEISPDQYDTFKALAEKFYSESSKNKFYSLNRNKDQRQMRARINDEIIKLLGVGDLDAALKMANDRLHEIYIQTQREKF